MILLFLFIGINVFAQKSYVNVVARDVENKNYIFLSGDIPSDMKNKYTSTIGEVICLLAKRGYVVEQMSCGSFNDGVGLYEIVILSKSLNQENENTKKDKENTELQSKTPELFERVSNLLGMND